jgi:hypothetical protein
MGGFIMRTFASAAFSVFALAACGQAAAPSNADAQTASTATNELSAADRTAMLHAIAMTADRSGQVENACSEKVTPTFTAIELGGAVGMAQLLVIPGGPNSATCYGDGPGDMHLFRRNGASFSEIHALSGAFLVVLPTSHNGVKDIADGGPGMSHPLYWWNGATYAAHGEIADSAMGDSAQMYPQ